MEKNLKRLRKAAGTFKGDPGQYVAKLVDAAGTFKGDPDRQIGGPPDRVDDGQRPQGLETSVRPL